MRFLAVATVFLAVFAGCSDVMDDSNHHPPTVFAVNLSDLPMDLCLGNPAAPLHLISGLEPGKTRGLEAVPVANEVNLYWKNSKDSIWTEWRNEENKPFEVDFRVGRTHAIVVRTGGKASLQILSEQYSGDPKLTILNDTGQTISQVQVGRELDTNVRAYAQELPPAKLTLLYSLPPGTWKIFWRMAGVEAFPEFNTLEPLAGQAPGFEFKKEAAYVLLLQYDRGSQTVKTSVLDISRIKN